MENTVKKYFRNLHNTYPFTSANGHIFQYREQEVREELTEAEIIYLIETEYQEVFSSASILDAWEQLLACEAVAKSTPIHQNYYSLKRTGNENVSVKGNVNGSYKRRVNYELTPSKLEAISKLREFNYLSSCNEIAIQLEIIFQDFPSKEGHWLKVAQYHTPRQIIWSLNYILKLHQKGRIRKNPAACFTHDIIRRKSRKSI